MTFAGQVISATSEAYVKYQMEELQGEYEDFLIDEEQQREELDEAMSLLGPEGSSVDILFITANTAMIDSRENPSDFFARTLNTNPGRDTLSVIGDYVDRALTLPELSPLDQFELA